MTEPEGEIVTALDIIEDNRRHPVEKAVICLMMRELDTLKHEAEGATGGPQEYHKKMEVEGMYALLQQLIDGTPNPSKEEVEEKDAITEGKKE